jgi:hypothetical protein
MFPARKGDVPDSALKRQHKVKIGSGIMKGPVGKELKEKVAPVLLEKAGHLDFEDLGLCLSVRVSLDLLKADLGVEAKIPLDNGIQGRTRSLEMIEKGSRGLGLGHLVLVSLCRSGKPLENGDPECWKCNVSHRGTKDLFCNPAEQGVRFPFRKDREQSRRILGSRHLWHNTLRQEFLESGLGSTLKT